MGKKDAVLSKDTRKNAQKGASGEKDNALWEEIQKLGGDMADLDMLKDVDNGGKGKQSKGSKVNKTELKGDLSEFAKSLGLATSIPDFVGLPDDERKSNAAKQEKKKPKSKSKSTEDQPAQADSSKSGDAAKVGEAPAKKSKNKYKDMANAKTDASSSTKAKSGKKSKAAGGNTDATSKDDDDTVDIPGFKVKSAKDSLPLSKAGRLTVQPNPQWFSIELGELELDEQAAKPSEEEILQKMQYAEQLLESEGDLYSRSSASKKSLSTSDRSFMSKILSSGTLSDRVSALTLIIQESPVHNLNTLGQLMNMVHKKNRREALMAVGSVKDLMTINLLPSDRKLKHFADQPLGAKNITREHWILWAFEDKLKRHYFDLIQVMESMAYDSVVHTRQNMLNYFEELLEQKPEQEQNLLRLLVNKLGDKERQLAAKASYLILKLLNAHPNMKFVVVKTIQELLLTKSSTKERAQYYTTITINQIILSSKDSNAANLLVDVYFDLFKKLLTITKDKDNAETAEAEKEANSDDEATGNKQKKAADKPKTDKKGRPLKVLVGQKALKKAKEEADKKREEEEKSMDNKLLAAILTGLHRALPYTKMEDSAMDGHIGVIFQIAHAGNFNTVVQSLVLLYQITCTRPSIEDRFFRTLYDSLLDHRLDTTSKKAMYLNVLFRALKGDSNKARVMAFIKRIMQVCLYNQAEFASGALFLVSQILSLNPQLYSMISQPEDNEDEVVVDADSDSEAASKKAAVTGAAAASGASRQYDPLKRDPRYANAESSCLWETVMLTHHFHPSITHSVKQIMQREQVPAISNLHNHSLAQFLERFVYRKPKGDKTAKGGADADSDFEDDMDKGDADDIAITKPVTLRGQSIMQPFIYTDGPGTQVGPNMTQIVAGDHPFASKRTKERIGGLDLNSGKVLQLEKSAIAPEDQFFHQFLATKSKRMGSKGKKGKKSGKDGESGFAEDDTGFASAVKGGDDDDMDEDEIWSAMTASMPKVKGGDDDEDDDDDDDLDMDDFGDDDDKDGLLAALGEDDSDSDNDDSDSDGGDSDSDDGDVPTFDDMLSGSEEDDDNDDASDSDAAETKTGAKRKGDDVEKEAPKDESSSKRKKKTKLPMFGTFEDYAHLIDNDEGLLKTDLNRASVFGDTGAGENNTSDVSDNDNESHEAGTKYLGKPSAGDAKKRNIDMFLQEIKRKQEQRHDHRSKRERTCGRTSGNSFAEQSGNTSTLQNNHADDGVTTNLYIGNVHPEVDEHALCVAFGKYGPIGSVKIMWPRTAEEHNRNKNSGFVSFMDRECAARALAEMDGRDLGGYALRVSWGKRVAVPAQPVFVLDKENPTKMPSTGYPFNAKPSTQRRVRCAGRTMMVAEEDQGDIPEIKVERPPDQRLVRLIHWTIEHVVEFGPGFEVSLISRTRNEPRFQFLVDSELPEHVYYRWKLYSLLNGDTKSKWHEQMFFMYDSGPVWIPPSTKHRRIDHLSDEDDRHSNDGQATDVSSSEAEEEAERRQDALPRDALGARARERLERRIRRVQGLERGAIADAMMFAIDHAHAADEVVDVVCRAILDPEALPLDRLGKLLLVSDILHNSSAQVANAWRLRQAFELRLSEIFGELARVFRAIDARLRAESFRRQVLSVLAVWQAWMMFPEDRLQSLAAGFTKL
ncbi:RNA-binding ribosome biosynthesis protein mak21 [Coemansia sp. RSA 1722]|nr:RNA-binding ribosome biosynthesis protein mak21 [Coemansia sp. RSA 1722]